MPITTNFIVTPVYKSILCITSVKNNEWSRDERVEEYMKQVGTITSTVHPYSCFSWLSCACLLMVIQWCYPYLESCMHVVEIHIILYCYDCMIDCRITARQFIPAPTHKTSIGMYSGCDYLYKSSNLVFFYPSIPTTSFNLIVFILVCILFYSPLG